ncbi:MAG: hypothetical protein RLZZ314_366 [Bacteroidota bacterium]|jgi:hypothetical protein
MTRIESPQVALSASVAEVSAAMNDWEVFGELLSSGPVTDFSASGNVCSFKVTGGVSIHLERVDAAVASSVLALKTVAPTPVKFSLDVVVSAEGDGSTCQVVCDAELNPFTRMMVEPALKGLFGQMSQALQSRF